MRTWTAGLGLFLLLAIAATPFAYWSFGSVKYRNFRIVHDGEFYRSGQMPPEGFERIVREFGIKTVISLRDTKDSNGKQDDQSEDDYCKANGLAFHRLPPGDWSPVDGVIPGEKPMTDFLRILDDPRTERPVLVHCFAGIHRTGAHCAIYRMEYDHWKPAEAIAEMRSMGTPRTTFADNLINYLTNYTPGKLRSGSAGSKK